MQSSIASALRRTALVATLVAAVGSAMASDIVAIDKPAANRQPAVSDPRSAETALVQARRLLDEGQGAEALAAIDVALQASPNDPRLRFQKGVILSREHRVPEAIDVFTALTQEFPELPEPYNNLAALYAERGELDQARRALENAVRALPTYALAHENLGDVYLQLAIRAWNEAVKLDPANGSAVSKLKLARELSARIANPGKPESTPALPGAR